MAPRTAALNSSVSVPGPDLLPACPTRRRRIHLPKFRGRPGEFNCDLSQPGVNRALVSHSRFLLAPILWVEHDESLARRAARGEQERRAGRPQAQEKSLSRKAATP